MVKHTTHLSEKLIKIRRQRLKLYSVPRETDRRTDKQKRQKHNILGRCNKLYGRPPQYARPCKLTFDLLTLKVVSESRVTWATSVPILVFLGLFLLDLGPMYATDRRQSRIIA